MSKKSNRDIAKDLYIESNGEKPLVDIAAELKVKPGTVRGWKSRYKWDKELGLNSATLQGDTCNVTEKGVTSEYNERKVEKKIEREISKNKGLTDKQQLFCIYYLKYYNATKAYQKAYKSSYVTANTNGPSLLVKTSIKKELDRLKEERNKAIEIDSQAIIQKYIDIAFADVTDYVQFGAKEETLRDSFGNALKDEDGEIITYQRNYVHFIDDENIDGTILSEIGLGQQGLKVKLHDKMKALEWLSERSSILTDMQKVKLEKEKTQTRKIEVEIDKITGNGSDIEDLKGLRELLLSD